MNGTARQFSRSFAKLSPSRAKAQLHILCNGKNAALGAIVDADGLILTKNTLLIGEISCKLKDGRVFPAEVLGEHDGSDLALLKIPAKELVPVKWRPSRELKQAMWLASVAPGLIRLPSAWSAWPRAITSQAISPMLLVPRAVIWVCNSKRLVSGPKSNRWHRIVPHSKRD